MDDNASNNSELKDDIRSGKVNLQDKYDDHFTYQELVEKDILDLMGFQNLTPEKRDELHGKIQERLENRIAGRILDSLSDIDKNTYDSLLLQGKDDEAYKFLLERNIDPREIFTSEALIMKLELYEDSKVITSEGKKSFKEDQQGDING